MPLQVSAVRQAMARILEAAFGAEVQVATAPDQITPPALFLGMPTITYHGSSSRAGIDFMEFPIWGIFPRTHDQTAVDLADEWASGIGDRSLLVLLEEDQTLGGACQTLVVRRTNAEVWNGSQGDLPAFHWTVEVWG
jgi:hypothetical protein